MYHLIFIFIYTFFNKQNTLTYYIMIMFDKRYYNIYTCIRF